MTILQGLHMGSDNAISQYDDFGTTFLNGTKVMVRVSFAAQAHWSDIAAPYFINSATKPWLASDPGRYEVLTVALVPDNPDASTTNNTLTAVSSGSVDSYWQTLGTNIHNTTYESRIIVRLGWEMNGDWYNWGIGNAHNGNTAAQYVAAFQRAVTQIRTNAPNVKFEWNISLTGRNINWTQAFPGSSYVNIFSIDAYDSYNHSSGGWTAMLSGTGLAGTGQGLTGYRSFCQTNGLQEAYTEWSLDTSANGNGDEIAYIQLMHAWMSQGNVFHQDYYNTSAWAGSAMVYGTNSGLVPRGAQMYQTLFSRVPPIAANVSVIPAVLSGGKLVPQTTPPPNYSLVCDGTNFYAALAA